MAQAQVEVRIMDLEQVKAVIEDNIKLRAANTDLVADNHRLRRAVREVKSLLAWVKEPVGL